MKKLAAWLLALLLLSAAGCAEKDGLRLDIGAAERIRIVYGSTGVTGDVTDAAEIRHITDNLNALTFSDQGETDSDGWSYALTWLGADGNVLKQLTLMGDGYTVILDGRVYRGMEADNEIDLAFLDRLFAD